MGVRLCIRFDYGGGVHPKRLAASAYRYAAGIGGVPDELRLYELAKQFGVRPIYERDYLTFTDFNQAEYVTTVNFLYKYRRDNPDEYQHNKIYEWATWKKANDSDMDYEDWLFTYPGNLLETAEKAYNDE